jgi:hypothetical protein
LGKESDFLSVGQLSAPPGESLGLGFAPVFMQFEQAQEQIRKVAMT